MDKIQQRFLLCDTCEFKKPVAYRMSRMLETTSLIKRTPLVVESERPYSRKSFERGFRNERYLID